MFPDDYASQWKIFGELVRKQEYVCLCFGVVPEEYRSGCSAVVAENGLPCGAS